MRGTRPGAAATVLVAGCGALAAAAAAPGGVEVGFRGDWRRATAGFQRFADTTALAGARSTLVHFHGLDGRAARVTLEVSAAPYVPAATLEVRRGAEAAGTARLHHAPSRVEVALPEGTADVDLYLEARGLGEGASRNRPFLLHAVALERPRDAAAVARSLAPLAGGLLVLAAARRRLPGTHAVAWALAAVAGLTAALVVAFDPAALLALRPAVRTGGHVAIVAALAALAVAGASRSPAMAAAGVLAAAFALHLPAIHNGLVYDDFLWARPWPLHEVASTFAGSEDPLGVSSTHYRPLPSVSHALDYLVWGFRPAGYRLTNILLLGANGLLVARLALRAGVGPAPAAIAGLVVVVHPLAASAVGWISERTDALVTGFVLLVLTALASADRPRALAVAPLALAAVWSKENAVMLPVLAALVVLVLRGAAALRERMGWILGLGLLSASYVAAWLALFPEKAGARAAQAMDYRNFDPASAGDWLRLVPGLLGPLLLPTDWQRWRDVPLREEPWAYTLAVVAVPAALAVVLGRCPECRSGPTRLLGLALLWAPVFLLPNLGLRRIDLYRVGLVAAPAAGLAAAALAAHVAHRRARLVPLLAAVLVASLAPGARRTVAGWAPEGFYYEAVLGFNREMTDWLAVLKPEARAQFARQVREQEHRAEVQAIGDAAAR